MTPPDPVDRFSRLDDTLEEQGASPPRSSEERSWLMQQRFVHGMLRALQGADAESREARVQAILEAIPRREARRRFLIGAGGTAAAASLLIASLWAFGAFDTPPSPELALPKPEQVLASAVRRMLEPVDRHYQLRVTYSGAPNKVDAFQVYLRGGGRFLVDGFVPEFGPVQPGHTYTARSDGTTLSFEYPDAPSSARIGKTYALEQVRRVHCFPGGLFGPEHFDFATLLAELPGSYDLTTEERLAQKPGESEPRVRVRAKRPASRTDREEPEIVAVIGERSGIPYQVQIVIEFRKPGEGYPRPFPGRGMPGGDRRKEPRHDEREEHEERGGGRGGPPGGKNERGKTHFHTLTFSYDEDVALAAQEYAPPK